MKVQVKEATAAAALVELEGSKNPAVLELAKSLRAVVDRPEDRGRLTAEELGAAVLAIDYARGFLPSRGGPLTEAQQAASGRARGKLMSQLAHERERTKPSTFARAMEATYGVDTSAIVCQHCEILIGTGGCPHVIRNGRLVRGGPESKAVRQA